METTSLRFSARRAPLVRRLKFFRGFLPVSGIWAPVLLLLSGAPYVPSASAAAPTVATLPAIAVGSAGATLDGTVDTGGEATSFHFEYGETAAYGSTTEARSVTSSLSFNGIKTFVTLPALDFSGGNALTVEAWVKPASLGGNRNLIRQEANGAPDFLLAFQDGGSLLSFGLTAGGVYEEFDAAVASGDFTDDAWHHVAGVYDGATVRVLVDGVEIATFSKAVNGAVQLSPGAECVLGSSRGISEFYSGQMDEVRLWTVARTPAEIAGSMGLAINGKTLGLAAYLPLNEGSGATARRVDS